VACRTFDPHYRSETIEEIPPSSEGVAFDPTTWCLLFRVYRTKDIGSQHVPPRVKCVPENSFSGEKRFKERSESFKILTHKACLSSEFVVMKELRMKCLFGSPGYLLSGFAKRTRSNSSISAMQW